MEVNYNVIILSGICVFLLFMNCIQMWQSSKRERELFDRILLSNDEYLANRVRTSKPSKAEIVAELNKIREERKREEEEADEIPID